MTITTARVLTVRQPWATLIATGRKRIETRAVPTKYRGPVLIHAGLRKADVTETGRGPWEPLLSPDGITLTHPLVFGFVIAVADLVDSLPIVNIHEDKMAPFCVANVWGDVHAMLTGEHQRMFPAEVPLGDFTPGRHGWLLDNVHPVAPIRWKGALGLRHAPDELLAQLPTEVLA